MGEILGPIIGGLIGYGFVYWVVWVVFGWFSTDAIRQQNWDILLSQ